MGIVSDTLSAVSKRVGKIIDARNVLDPNGKTRRSFAGRIVGTYRRTGPNSWDDYRLVFEDRGPIDVFPSVKIHVEPRQARFRMRSKGEVILVEWAPGDEERAELGEDADLHAAFLESCVQPFGYKPGIGVTAYIAKTLRK